MDGADNEVRGEAVTVGRCPRCVACGRVVRVRGVEREGVERVD